MVKATGRRLVPILLAVVMVCAAVCTMLLTLPSTALAAAPSVWNGDLKAAGWGGAGEKPNEYVESTGEDGTKTISIGSAAALAYFAHQVYVDSSHQLDGATVTLTTDINLDGHMWMPIGQTNSQIPPSIRFSGTFDGNGKTISHLNATAFYDSITYDGVDDYGDPQYYVAYEDLKLPIGLNIDNSAALALEAAEYCYGLFGVASNVTIKNLTVENIDFQFKDRGYLQSATGVAHERLVPSGVGTLIGYAYGNVSLQNCVAGSATKQDDQIVMEMTNGAIGGLVGRIEARNNRTISEQNPLQPVTIQNCYNYVSLIENFAGLPASGSYTGGTTSKVGGIVGQANYFASLLIENCKNYGDIIGGAQLGGITSNWSSTTNTNVNVAITISRCDNYGNIKTNDGTTTTSLAGGIVAYLQNSNIATGRLVDITVQNCNNYGNVAAKNATGGIVGQHAHNTGVKADFRDNYNYGDVFCLTGGTRVYVGGYVGSITGANTEREFNITGGGMGKVYRTSGTDSLIGNNALKSASASNYTENLVNASTVVTMQDEEIANVVAENWPAEHSTKTPEEPTSGTKIVAENLLCDESGKIVLGLAPNASLDNGLLIIPSGIDRIATGAFIGNTSITKVVFTGMSTEKLSIGDFAFANTSVEEVTLSQNVISIGEAAFANCTSLVTVSIANGLEKIGEAAFANCTNLNNVALPSYNADKIVVGEDAFRSTRLGGATEGTYIIAPNYATYSAVKTAGNFDNCGGILTHVVTIHYSYDGRELQQTEQVLRGQAYNVRLNDNKWESLEISVVGPTSDGVDYVWYPSQSSRTPIIQPAAVVKFIEENEGNEVWLYAFDDSKLVVVMLTDIVYNENTSYTTDNLADLIVSSNREITAEMWAKTTILYNGQPTTTIHNAGTYSITIDNSDAVEVVIVPATIDLAYTYWHVEVPVDGRFLTSTLYIYTDANGEEYPSNQLLNAQQRKELELSDDYVTRNVTLSAVRQRGANSQVTIELETNHFDVTYTQNSNVATGVGTYVTTAQITTNSNYRFVVGSIDSELGVTVRTTSDTTATITKKWYIVDYSNWLVDASGNDYTIGNHVYGNGGNYLPVQAPALLYGDAGEITMHLYLTNDVAENVKVSGEAGFGTDKFTYYVNRFMPAGNYSLVVEVPAITTKDAETNTDVYHASFSETLTFTVEKAVMQLAEIDAINAALKAQEFTIEAGTDALYNTTEALNAVAALANVVSVTREGYWGTVEALPYYSGYTIEYNLLRDHSDEYKATRDDVSKADTYIVFYRISASNYYSTVERLTGSEDRYSYYFTVIKYSVISLPMVTSDGLTYNGNRQLPTVTSDNSKLFETAWSTTDNYVNAGAHTVTFTLIDADHYHWDTSNLTSAQKVEGAIATVEFTIAQAKNSTATSLNMLSWSFGEFDAAVNSIRAIFTFGTHTAVHLSIWEKDGAVVKDLDNFSIDANGQVDSSVAEKLKQLHTGTYTLKVKVDGTTNYAEFTDEMDFTVSPTYNSWLEGDDDLVIPNWVQGKFNPDNMVIKAKYGTVYIRIISVPDSNGDFTEYYNSKTAKDSKDYSALNKMPVGSYLLVAWVEGDTDFSALLDRTFAIHVFEQPGLPWWAILLIAVGTVGLAALVVFVLWKQGVFQVVTDKILIALRTRVTVEATIASVRAAKMMEEGRKSVEEAKRRELEEQQAQEQTQPVTEPSASEPEQQVTAEETPETPSEE